MTPSAPVVAREQMTEAHARLASLDCEAIDAQEFWKKFLAQTRRTLGAQQAFLLERRGGVPWQAVLSDQDGDDGLALVNPLHVITMADAAALEAGHHAACVDGKHWLACLLACGPRGEAPNQAVLVLGFAPGEAAPSVALQAWMDLVAQLPRHQVLQDKWRALGSHQHDAQGLYDMLRLSLRVGEQERFMGAAFSLCNELVARHRATHVMLGWVKGGMVELRAISQVEKFDVKSAASRSLVEAMEEVVDQELAVIYPAPEGSRVVNRAHDQCAKAQGIAALSSVPIRWKNQVVGVLTVEAADAPLTDAALWELELVIQLCVQHLMRSERRDRWLGQRVWDTGREWLAYWLEPKHLGLKGMVAGVLALLVGAAILPWSYRIEAQASLHSKDLLFIPAPFDGYLSQVHVDIGDVVQPGDLLVALDTRDLAQEVRMASADVTRYQGEAEKAQAQKAFAEMQIARAREQQAQAKLTLVQQQLDSAQVLAPMAGTVVEGELRKNLGSPVRRGDLLLKLAQNRNLYLEVAVDQSDVQEIHPGMTGEVAFVGRPEDRFGFTVTSMEPAAIARDGKNVFLVRAQINAQPGWHPGLGGTAKLDAGEHALLWVLTRRTVRYLRGLFWL